MDPRGINEETTTPFTSDDEESNTTFTSYSTKFYKPLQIKTDKKNTETRDISNENFPKFSQYLEIDNDISFISNTSTLHKYKKNDQSIDMKPTLIKNLFNTEDKENNPYLCQNQKITQNFGLSEAYYKSIVLKNQEELEEENKNIQGKNNLLGNWDSVLCEINSKKPEESENKIEYYMVPKFVESAQVSKRDCLSYQKSEKKYPEVIQEVEYKNAPNSEDSDILKFEYSRTLSDKQRCMTREVTNEGLSHFEFYDFEEYRERKPEKFNPAELEEVKKSLSMIEIDQNNYLGIGEKNIKISSDKEQFSSMFNNEENRFSELKENKEFVYESDLNKQKITQPFDRNTFGKPRESSIVPETPNQGIYTDLNKSISTNKLVNLKDFYFNSANYRYNQSALKASRSIFNPKVLKTSSYLNQKNWCIKKQCFIYSFYRKRIKQNKRGRKIFELIRLGEQRDLVSYNFLNLDYTKYGYSSNFGFERIPRKT